MSGLQLWSSNNIDLLCRDMKFPLLLLHNYDIVVFPEHNNNNKMTTNFCRVFFSWLFCSSYLHSFCRLFFCSAAHSSMKWECIYKMMIARNICFYLISHRIKTIFTHVSMYKYMPFSLFALILKLKYEERAEEEEWFCFK